MGEIFLKNSDFVGGERFLEAKFWRTIEGVCFL